MQVVRLLSAVAAASVLGSCVKVPPPNQNFAADLPPPAGGDDEYSVQLPKPPPRYDRLIHLALGEDVDRSCEVDEAHFFFDQSTPRPQAYPKVRALAACLNAPPYQDLEVLLIGRADPRGTAEYNAELGRKRAEFVKDLLVEGGVDSGRITVLTAGEALAKGDQEAYSYGYDRRVDVVQLGFSHTPVHAEPKDLQPGYAPPR